MSKGSLASDYDSMGAPEWPVHVGQRKRPIKAENKDGYVAQQAYAFNAENDIKDGRARTHGTDSCVDASAKVGYTNAEGHRLRYTYKCTVISTTAKQS